MTTNTTGDGSSSEPVNVPLLQDLMSDVGDGSSVAALIAYYRPRLLNIKSEIYSHANDSLKILFFYPLFYILHTNM